MKVKKEPCSRKQEEKMAEENRSFSEESLQTEPESKNFIENFIDED